MARSRTSKQQVKDLRTESQSQFDGLYLGNTAQLTHAMRQCESSNRIVKSGSDLFRTGDKCENTLSLVDGWFALYEIMEDGRRQILHFAMPGALLTIGYAPELTATYSARALTDALVSVIHPDDIERLCGQDPRIALQLAHLISRDRSLAYDHLSSLGRRSARERVAHLLLELFIRSRAQWPGYRVEEMQLPLVQEDIADATGLTGVHVNRVLQDLRRHRVLEFHYRRLKIINPDALVDAAGVDPTWLLHRSQLPAQVRLSSDPGGDRRRSALMLPTRAKSVDTASASLST
jgi:CRP-like cAMP-binding protein